MRKSFALFTTLGSLSAALLLCLTLKPLFAAPAPALPAITSSKRFPFPATISGTISPSTPPPAAYTSLMAPTSWS